MLTILFCSRVKGNPDGNIKRFLDSLVDCGATKDNCEVILKYDDDDDLRPSAELFASYPFNIKVHVWSRGEGRHSIHTDHFYLFTRHDPNSKFVMLGSDDFTFTRKGFIDDILGIDKEFTFVGYARPQMEVYAPHWREPWCMNVWKHNEGVSLPCMSTRTLEVLQNYGWQSNGDNWVTLICILLYANYNIDLWSTVAPFYIRNPTDGASSYKPCFNDMEIGGNKNSLNPYYFDLVSQQVKNLYLNMKEKE